MTRYRSFHAAMKDRFGCKVYKLSLDGGMTCPNRDGTAGTGGCLFCGDRGAGSFAAPPLRERPGAAYCGQGQGGP